MTTPKDQPDKTADDDEAAERELEELNDTPERETPPENRLAMAIERLRRERQAAPDNGLSNEEISELADIDLVLGETQNRISGTLDPHRSVSMAMTKLDEARMWLRDRLTKKPMRRSP